MAAITSLYRFPIKGLSAEPLRAMTLSRDGGLPFDRDLALALGTTTFDPDHPEPLDKGCFLMLRANDALAALSTGFDPDTRRLTVKLAGALVLEADLATERGRAETERFFEDYIGPATKGRPRLVQAENHKFTDGSVVSPAFMRAVSLINLASVRELEGAAGRPVEPLRFRANIYIDGLAPWEEMNWVGREVRIGDVRFRVLERTPRCAAVNVNPGTAERDVNLLKILKQHFGHVDLGVYLEVLEDGTVLVNDPVHLPGVTQT